MLLVLCLKEYLSVGGLIAAIMQTMPSLSQLLRLPSVGAGIGLSSHLRLMQLVGKL